MLNIIMCLNPFKMWAVRRDITEGFCLPPYSYLRMRQKMSKV
jgi:hypothetical protein